MRFCFLVFIYYYLGVDGFFGVLYGIEKEKENGKFWLFFFRKEKIKCFCSYII